jgi:hypothetical protein
MPQVTFTTYKLKLLLKIIVSLLVACLMHYFLGRAPLGVMLSGSCIVLLTRTGSVLIRGLWNFLILLCVATLATFILSKTFVWYHMAFDMAVGAMIGILVNLTIFPAKITQEFRGQMITLLNSYEVFFEGIIALLIYKKTGAADKGKILLEINLKDLPTWVFDVGFDLKLQTGYQYFFIKTAHISEILFTLHHLAKELMLEDFIEDFQEPLALCQVKINKFIVALNTVLNLQTLTEPVMDFDEEIQLLEKIFKHNLAASLDELELNKKYLFFKEFIYTLKEFHDSLLKLAETMR